MKMKSARTTMPLACQARISFDGREESVAFALGAIAADMTRD